MLTVQYRMHEQIMQFSSDAVLRRPADGRTHRGATPAWRHYDLRFAPDLPVEFLDTAGFGFTELTIPESRSTANPEEADLLLKRLGPTAGALRPGRPRGRPAQHRRHCALPRPNQLPEGRGGGKRRAERPHGRTAMLSVGTVDSFQGQERDIIAISLDAQQQRTAKSASSATCAA
ncbi:MAG: hypothetical protein WKG07_49090 [Hymenobacter sp.]